MKPARRSGEEFIFYSQTFNLCSHCHIAQVEPCSYNPFHRAGIPLVMTISEQQRHARVFDDREVLRSVHQIAARATSDRLHICLVTETYPPEVNGVAKTVARLAEGLSARGHLVSLIRPRQNGVDSSIESPPTLVRGWPLPGYEGLQFGLPAGRLLRAQWTKNRPDIVYIATEGPLGWSAMRTAERLGIAALSGFHTNYHSYSRHYRLRYLQWLVFRYLRYFHNNTRGTMVPSPDLRKGLQERGFKNVAFVGRGVDSFLFAPEQRSTELRRSWGLADHELAVLYVGRIAAEKNLQLAVDAYYKMYRIDSAIKFILVGDGPLRANLQKRYPILIFSGMKTGDALARHYASGDIFLFPSETETFGNVTLEAMASGLAVVAFNCAAAKLHIVHNENGLLVPCGDSTGFISCAVRLVHDRRLLYRLRRKAREAASSVDWAHAIVAFESWLDTAVAKRTGTNLCSAWRRPLVANMEKW